MAEDAAAKPVPWDKLDKEFVRGVEPYVKWTRPRRFSRIFRAGHDPEFTLSGRTPINLVDETAENPLYKPAKETFHSLFWKAITPPGLQAREISELHDVALQKLRFTKDISARGNLLSREFDLEGRKALHTGAALVAQMESFDALYVLCIEVRYAMNELDFVAAQIYIDAVRLCLRRIMHRFRIPIPIYDALLILTEKRAIRNDWSPVDEAITSRGRRKKLPEDDAGKVQLLNELMRGDGRFVTSIPRMARPIIPIGPTVPQPNHQQRTPLRILADQLESLVKPWSRK